MTATDTGVIYDAIIAQKPYELGHRVEICTLAFKEVRAAAEPIVARVLDRGGILFWQQAALTYEKTLLDAEASRDAWQSYAEHFERCESCRRMMRADDATAVLCLDGLRLRGAAAKS